MAYSKYYYQYGILSVFFVCICLYYLIIDNYSMFDISSIFSMNYFMFIISLIFAIISIYGFCNECIKEKEQKKVKDHYEKKVKDYYEIAWCDRCEDWFLDIHDCFKQY